MVLGLASLEVDDTNRALVGRAHELERSRSRPGFARGTSPEFRKSCRFTGGHRSTCPGSDRRPSWLGTGGAGMAASAHDAHPCGSRRSSADSVDINPPCHRHRLHHDSDTPARLAQHDPGLTIPAVVGLRVAALTTAATRQATPLGVPATSAAREDLVLASLARCRFHRDPSTPRRPRPNGPTAGHMADRPAVSALPDREHGCQREVGGDVPRAKPVGGERT